MHIKNIEKMTVLFLCGSLWPTLFAEKIFKDGLSSDWTVKPWENTTVAVVATKPKGNAIQAIVDHKFGRLYLTCPAGFKTSSKRIQFLELSIFIASGSGEIFVSLYDQAGKPLGTAPGTAYIADNTWRGEKWYGIRIPLNDLGGVGTIIGGVVMEATNPMTFYVNHISITDAPGSGVVPPAVTSVTVSCDPSPARTFSQCTAQVDGTGNPSQAVIWKTTSGSISAAGYYIPPTVPTRATITATSIFDPSKSGSVEVLSSGSLTRGIEK